ncbi:MAG: hypothetical protein K2X27_05165, partial [Candidatus Obscuribacterales bacterium]|nr:hypothetical protein [Candidatus Obscuribacterales bacterium]
ENRKESKMNCKTCSCGSTPNHLHIPPRGPFEKLAEMGVQRTCVSDSQSVQMAAPEGWSIEPTEVSPFHHHLVDAEGKLVACLLTKPGSGGAGSFQLTSKDNCAAVGERALRN